VQPQIFNQKKCHFQTKQANNKEFPAHVFDVISHQEDCKFSNTENVSTEKMSTVDKKPTFFDLFYPKIILLRSLNMFYQWFSVTMCYYGLSYASTSLFGDPYTNFSLSVFIEIPGQLIE
jgi:hypothetical protein